MPCGYLGAPVMSPQATTKTRAFAPAVLLGLAIAACGKASAPPADAVGMLFDPVHLDLGTRTRGEQVEVAFPFEVLDHAVTVNDFELSCGCVEVQLVDAAGAPLPLREALAAGTTGELRVVWETKGYSGGRQSTIRVLGSGPGLPQTLRFDAELESWYQFEPKLAEFPAAGRDEEQRLTVRLSAPEAFEILDIAASFPGVRPGKWSSGSAHSHTVELIREAHVAEEGQRTGFVQLRTDREGLVAAIPVRYTIASEVWVQPGRRWLLGEVNSGQYQAPELILGARTGTLEVLDLVWEGPEGGELKLVTVEPDSRFKVELVLPADLASGPVRGTIHVRLAHRNLGEETIVEREIPVYGLVTS